MREFFLTSYQMSHLLEIGVDATAKNLAQNLVLASDAWQTAKDACKTADQSHQDAQDALGKAACAIEAYLKGVPETKS